MLIDNDQSSSKSHWFQFLKKSVFETSFKVNLTEILDAEMIDQNQKCDF